MLVGKVRGPLMVSSHSLEGLGATGSDDLGVGMEQRRQPFDVALVGGAGVALDQELRNSSCALTAPPPG